MAKNELSSDDKSYPIFAVRLMPIHYETVYVRFISSDRDPVEYNALSVVCPKPFRNGKITQKCRSLVIAVAQHYARALGLALRVYVSPGSNDVLSFSPAGEVKANLQYKYTHPRLKIGTFEPETVLNAPALDHGTDEGLDEIGEIDEIKEIECEGCSASVKLANREANRCSDCGLEYDGDGGRITGDVVCPECWGTVYLISKESNECESCGLKYDGDGRPVGEPPPGVYIGDQEVGGVGTASMENYYVDYNGDGTWTVYHYGGHPALVAEEGPYDADELLEALEEFGFDREEMIEMDIKGLNAALKKRRTTPVNRDVKR